MSKTGANLNPNTSVGMDLRQYSKLIHSNNKCDIKQHKVNLVKKPRGRPKKHVETKLCGPNLVPNLNGSGDFRVKIQEEVSIKLRYCFNTKPTNWMYFWFISHVLLEFSYQMWYSIVQLKHRQDLVELMINRFEFLKLIAMQQFAQGSKNIDRTWESKRISYSHDQLACLFLESFNAISMENWNDEILRLQNRLWAKVKDKSIRDSRSDDILSIHDKVFLLAETCNRQITPAIEWMIITLEDIYAINKNSMSNDFKGSSTAANIPILTKNYNCNKKFSANDNDVRSTIPVLSINASDFQTNTLGINERLIKGITACLRGNRGGKTESYERIQVPVLYELMMPELPKRNLKRLLQHSKDIFLSKLQLLDNNELSSYLTEGSQDVQFEISYRNCVLYHSLCQSSFIAGIKPVVSSKEEEKEEGRSLDHIKFSLEPFDELPEVCIETEGFTPARKLWHDRWMSELAKSKVYFVEGFPKGATEHERKYWNRLEELLVHYFKHFGVTFIGFSINDFETVKLPPPCLQTRYVIFRREGPLKMNKNPRLWDYGKAIRFLQDMGLDVSSLQNIFSLLQDGTLRKRKIKRDGKGHRSSQKRFKRGTVTEEKLVSPTFDWNESLEQVKFASSAITGTPQLARPLVTTGLRKHVKEDSVELDGSIEKDTNSLSVSGKLSDAELSEDKSVIDGNTTICGAASLKASRFEPPQFVAESSQLSDMVKKPIEEPDSFYTAPETTDSDDDLETEDIFQEISSHANKTWNSTKNQIPKRYHGIISGMLDSINEFTVSKLIEENQQWSNLFSERDQLIHTLSSKLIEKEKLVATYQGKLQQIHAESSTEKLPQ